MARKRIVKRVRMDLLVPEVTKRSVDEYSRYCSMSMTEYVVQLVKRDSGRLAREIGANESEGRESVCWFDDCGVSANG